jgi:hypothetical protein
MTSSLFLFHPPFLLLYNISFSGVSVRIAVFLLFLPFVVADLGGALGLGFIFSGENKGARGTSEVSGGGEGISEVSGGGEGTSEVSEDVEGTSEVSGGGVGTSQVSGGGEGTSEVSGGGEGTYEVYGGGDGQARIQDFLQGGVHLLAWIQKFD